MCDSMVVMVAMVEVLLIVIVVTAVMVELVVIATVMVVAVVGWSLVILDWDLDWASLVPVIGSIRFTGRSQNAMAPAH